MNAEESKTTSENIDVFFFTFDILIEIANMIVSQTERVDIFKSSYITSKDIHFL